MLSSRLRPDSGWLLLASLAAILLTLSACSRGTDDHAQVYAALGASDAVGIGATRPSVDGWVPLVQAGLPGNPQLVNLGISGATLDTILALELPVLEDAKPDIVTIWVGVNDLRAGVKLPEFTERLDETLARIAASGPSEIAVLNIPDLQQVPDFQGHDPVTFDAEVRQWNVAIAEIAARHGARVVDLYGPSLALNAHPEYISGDGFHPSSAGYQRIAELVLIVLGQR
jgi:lysophospholipase L1-like esterase